MWFYANYFTHFNLWRFDWLILFRELWLLKKVIFFAGRIHASFSFIVALYGNVKGKLETFVSFGYRFWSIFAIGVIIEGLDIGGVDGGLALLTVEEDFVWGVLRKRCDDFTWPIRIILAFGEDHFSEAVLIDHYIAISKSIMPSIYLFVYNFSHNRGNTIPNLFYFKSIKQIDGRISLVS